MTACADSLAEHSGCRPHCTAAVADTRGLAQIRAQPGLLQQRACVDPLATNCMATDCVATVCMATDCIPQAV